MRTLTTTVYNFNELTADAQQNAISSLYDLNVDHDWWEFIYDDAERVGLKITSFDIGRGNSISGDLEDSLNGVCDAIIKNHGEICDTYKMARRFLNDWGELVTKYSDGINTDIVTDDNEYDFDQEADELEEEFKNDLLEDYLQILSNEYKYLTSEEAIKESIEANSYEFTEEGEMI